MQNLIKFQGLKLPGGVELNGRQIYDDAQKEIDAIQYNVILSLDFESDRNWGSNLDGLEFDLEALIA